MHLPQIDDETKQRLMSHVLMPALAGGAGTGLLSAYLSRNSGPDDESPMDRRRRIMRNAMIGTTLGGVAGAALPTGIEMLAKPYLGGPSDSTGGRIGDSLLGHAGALGVGALGGLRIDRAMTANKSKALQHIIGALRASNVPIKGLSEAVDAKGKSMFNAKGITPESLTSFLHTPGGRMKVLETMGHQFGTPGGDPRMNNMFFTNDVLHEAGFPGFSHLKEMPGVAAPGNAAKWGFDSEPEAREAFSGYLKEQGPISKLFGNLAGKRNFESLNLLKYRPMAALAEKSPLAAKAMLGMRNFDPLTLAEGYNRVMRPSISKLVNPGRIPLALQLGALGAGMYGVDKLQQSVAGS